MSTHQPTTVNELITYTKRRLGEDAQDPDFSYIEIDLSQNQWIDIVNYAVQKYQSEHFSGAKRYLHYINIQQGVTSYKLPGTTIAVLGYLESGDHNSMFSLDYQTRQQFGMQMNQFDIVSVEVTFQYLDLINYKLSKKIDWEFNGLTKEFYMHNNDSESAKAIAVLAYNVIDPTGAPNLYNELWMKDYTYALAKCQWGETLKKFGNVKLPGGITINAKEIYDEGVALKKELETELSTKWSKPPRFFCG